MWSALLLLVVGLFLTRFVTQWAFRIALGLGVALALGVLSLDTVTGWWTSPTIRQGVASTWNAGRRLTGVGVDSLVAQVRGAAAEARRQVVDTTRRVDRTPPPAVPRRPSIDAMPRDPMPRDTAPRATLREQLRARLQGVPAGLSAEVAKYRGGGRP